MSAHRHSSCAFRPILVGLLYSLRGSTGYMYTISAILTVLGAGLAVLFLFIIFTRISFTRLLITMVPVLVFGFFLSYNIRRMVGPLLTPGQRQPRRVLQRRPRQWSRQNLGRGSFRCVQTGGTDCRNLPQDRTLIIIRYQHASRLTLSKDMRLNATDFAPLHSCRWSHKRYLRNKESG